LDKWLDGVVIASGTIGEAERRTETVNDNKARLFSIFKDCVHSRNKWKFSKVGK
jgi:hypothetical protein